MSIKIAGVDLFNQGLDNEFRISVLEKIVETILSKNPNILSNKQLKEIRLNVVRSLQTKYPEAGIELNEVKND
ncbi:MAG TPA: hypothetical protein PKL04_01190 [Methanofastidiosum sp.]|nr:hypothetical protein [Methanofastidiosum sp.]